MTAGLLIVGGGAAAHAALAAYRKQGGPGSAVLVSEDDRPPYNRPPLSKDFLRGESEATSLPLDQPEFYSANDCELVLSSSVVALDPHARLVRTDSGREISYERCILATGSVPTTPSFPGAEHTLSLRWLDQAVRLRETAQSARSAVVIGSGFIGCEAAASLAARGLAVTMVSGEPQPQLRRLGTAAADLISGWLTDAGVRIRSDVQVAGVTAIGSTRQERIVELSDGTTLSADLVLAAVGVQPRAELAEQAGLTVRDGRIEVDEHMRTSADHVFAAGDVVSAHNSAAGRHLSVEHWGEAERMGEIAGTVAAGGNAVWAQAPGFWSEIGDHTLKYAAWGDGFDLADPVRHADGGLTVWYSTAGVTVGVLTSNADDDYDRGPALVEAAAPVPTA